jgi:hypothetical protein
MTVLSIQARTRTTTGLGVKSLCNHPSQALSGNRHPEHNAGAQEAHEHYPSAEDAKSETQDAWSTVIKRDRAEIPTETGAFRDPKRLLNADGPHLRSASSLARASFPTGKPDRGLHETVQFRTYEHPRERGGRLFHSLGVGITQLLERCIVRQGSLCIVEPVSSDWGGFPTATMLMLLGVPAAGAAAALAEAFAPLDRHESQRRQSTLIELLNEMERLYGSSVRFALAHGSDASLLGNLRFAYLAR